MLKKIRKALGFARKNYREREITWIGYSENPSRLVIVFSDGSMRTHLNVMPGYIVGLRVAADKLDYYETQVAPSNVALEISGARTIASTSTRASIHIRPGSSLGVMGFGAHTMEVMRAGVHGMRAQSMKTINTGGMNMGARAAAAPERRRAHF
ncbi:hypothetical protein FHX15_001842 [Rhizobium sp. BK650]|uniref:hypothetical protein n=1 Tax=Rhizobium sp. BK650 TaxID=2586990 RepID=UPI0016070D6F|nr:hypothetical protein [Rhizobium sp. BK650]MBB3656614.1 hypothetical protein [Rhizobium sp. BK650]